MDFVKEWALGLVVAAIAGTVALVLTPHSAVEKQVRTAISLFLLVAFVYPFISDVDTSDIFSSIQIQYPESADDTGMMYIAESVKSETQSKIAEVLERNGINYKEINIDISVKENNEVEIKRICVLVENESDVTRSENILKEDLEILAEAEVG